MLIRPSFLTVQEGGTGGVADPTICSYLFKNPKIQSDDTSKSESDIEILRSCRRIINHELQVHILTFWIFHNRDSDIFNTYYFLHKQSNISQLNFGTKEYRDVPTYRNLCGIIMTLWGIILQQKWFVWHKNFEFQILSRFLSYENLTILFHQSLNSHGYFAIIYLRD